MPTAGSCSIPIEIDFTDGLNRQPLIGRIQQNTAIVDGRLILAVKLDRLVETGNRAIPIPLSGVCQKPDSTHDGI